MVILALDTSTRHATVAVCEGERLVAEGSRQVTTHSEGLLVLIHETLQAAGTSINELDAVACGRGPGSFTGLRIGMATAKGLCYAAAKPLVCISSLMPLDAAAREALGGGMQQQDLVAAVLDARRQEVFCGLFRGGALVQREFVCSPQTLATYLPPDEAVVLAGDGALNYWDLLQPLLGEGASLAPDRSHVVQARYIAAAAQERLVAGDVDDLGAAIPLYIRPTDARLPG